MANNNLGFEYTLNVNEKATRQNLNTFIKNTFGEGKNAKYQSQQQSMADSALSSTTTASAVPQPQIQPQPQAMGYDSSTADAPLNGPENFQDDDFDDLVF